MFIEKKHIYAHEINKNTCTLNIYNSITNNYKQKLTFRCICPPWYISHYPA